MIILQHSGGTNPTSEGFVDDNSEPPAPGSTTGSAWNVSGDYDRDYDLYNMTAANVTALTSAATWTFTATFNTGRLRPPSTICPPAPASKPARTHVYWLMASGLISE
jgi:hypothetical protein